jgi:hypothetical protein
MTPRTASPRRCSRSIAAGTSPPHGDVEWRRLRGGLGLHVPYRGSPIEPPDAIAGEVRDASGQTDGIGVVLAPGCVLPLDVPDASLKAVVSAVQAAAR